MSDFEVLKLLLNAKSKDFVLKVCHESISAVHTKDALETITSTLDCSPEETTSLIHSLNVLITALIQKNTSLPEEIIAVFPEGFHKSLATLLTKILTEMLPFWRSQILENQVSPPKLSSFSWSVSTQQDSSTPLCFLNLNVSEEGERRSVNAHLTKESLNSLLTGLKQIKSQINTLTSWVARKLETKAFVLMYFYKDNAVTIWIPM